MESIKHLLFEGPMYAYISLAVAELVIAAMWRQSRSRRMALLLLVPPLLAGTLLVLDLTVDTDHKKLQRSLNEIAADVQAGKVSAVGEFLADDMTGYYPDRQSAIRAGEAAYREAGITGVTVSNADIEFHDSLATVQLRTTVHFNHPQMGSGQTVIGWTIYWAKRDGQWKIIGINEPKQGF